jgi:membrane-associated phospholipid phosphatase
MEQEVASYTTSASAVMRLPEGCRPSERVLLAYFLYTAAMAVAHSLGPARQVLAVTIPVLLWSLANVESRRSQPWSRVLREWLPLGFILVAYRQVDWFQAPPLAGLQQTLVDWDRILLNRWGLRALIESLGRLIPSVLEFSYLCLYLIPPFCVGALYWFGQRKRVDRFLSTFFMGTFAAYALLPYFPTLSPRLAFPHSDLPISSGWWRSANLWLLNRMDITTSVFPSGHVAAAFSAAFGLWRTLPERRIVCYGVLLMAGLVYLATIYCRYHYAADGAASLLISLLALLASEAYERFD